MLKGNLDPVVGIVFNGNKQALLFQNWHLFIKAHYHWQSLVCFAIFILAKYKILISINISTHKMS
jgi:hypothetical protein